jgi:lysophospholipase L1-like esterase
MEERLNERRRALIAVCAVLVVVTLGSVLAAAAAARQLGVTPGSRYLAIGDSVTFGYQEPQVMPAPNYHDPASLLGYPEQLGAQLHLRVINASCPGETSGSLINTSTPSNGCENAYRKLYPLHVRYTGAQLAFAVSYLRHHPRTRLVSLMVGANDVFLCQKTTPDGCTSSAELQATFTKISANVRRILSAIRRQARYRGQLAIVNYYSLNYASAFINGISQRLNKAMDSAARPFHVEIADGYGELRAAAEHSGGDTCAAGLLTQLGSPGKCGVHPSFAGQALLASALLQAIKL